MFSNTRLSRLRRLAPIIGVRIILIGLLLSTYLVAWRPARSWFASEIIRPALLQIDTGRSDNYSVHAASTVVEVYRTNSSERVAKTKPPLGGVFVFVGMLFVALNPRNFCWLYLIPYQLGLTALMFGTLTVGVGWADWGYTICKFLGGGFYKGTSFAIPFLLLRADGRTLFGAVTPGAGRSVTKGSED